MSIYDILMLAVMVGSILFGLWKGLAWQVASLASILVSYFVAINFRGSLSPYISAVEPWNRFAAMLILFLGTSLIIWMFYGYIKTTIRRYRLRGFDTQAGGILGAVKGFALCLLITLFAVTLFGSNIRQGVVASKSGGYFSAAINRLHSMFPEEVQMVLHPHVQEFNEHLDQESPGFVNASQQKLDEKLQVFRGQFQDPATSTPPPRVGSNQIQFNNGEAQSPQAGSLGDQFRNQVRDQIGNQLIESTKEAGRKIINDVGESLNR